MNLFAEMLRKEFDLPQEAREALDLPHQQLLDYLNRQLDTGLCFLPWTIWPTLVILWGVCWMFYPGDGLWNISDYKEVGTDLQWGLHDTDDLPGGDSFDGATVIHTPAFLNEPATTTAFMQGIMCQIPREVLPARAIDWPQIPFATNDRLATPGLPDDGLWDRGVPATVVQAQLAPSSTAASQTQLNATVERGGSLRLASASSGRPGGLQDLDIGAEEPLFVCNFANCGKTFSLRSSLRAHVNRHEKPFMCDICRRRFGSKKEVQRHESSIHSDEKPFICTWPQCKRSRQGWAREDNYQRHVRTVHHGEYGPAALLSSGVGVRSNLASRKRQREEREEDAESDFRSEPRRKDEKTRDLEERIEETKRLCKEYKELFANSKEENIRLREEIACLKGRCASAGELSLMWRTSFQLQLAN
ncbi:hypothetical protein DL766_005700 [Monosporascus sp. MC13-8B]|uniref:C2H2-type domain-containing protein n=1 Tax=Monosporascus cannonballus TaxID=155416 RepID=A0ABY0HI75_9PEZI|nr:hypothetical protein DL762_001292 [Monosporascus cannonballus]RYO99726.1 hypothetical protein DL763_001334 [Monosporascus cannonballus]RYP28786.1 hypothetical protein DL766_005700 [Monosporascus sp. MC13-8B]